MLSIEHIREHPDEARASLKTRGDEDTITEVLALDAQIRTAITERDDLNAERNRVSKELGQARSQGQEISDDTRAEMRRIGDQADALNEETKALGQAEQTNARPAQLASSRRTNRRERVRQCNNTPKRRASKHGLHTQAPLGPGRRTRYH